jgi:2-polyprenyl-6-methoxyphenol hydroxylase-like FAD-dependent oxidoreductase
MDEQFIKKGVKVQNVIVHGTKRIIGRVAYNNIKSNCPFILSIPQIETEKILENNLKKYDSVEIKKGCEFNSIEFRDDILIIRAKNLLYKGFELHKAKYLIACDGSKSDVRKFLKIPSVGNRYKYTFFMGDFIDKSGLNEEAHLFFTKYGPVESFPLPDGKRRWIVETKGLLKNPEINFLENQVEKKTGINLKDSQKTSESPFGVQHYLNKIYFKDRILFCGDSAHVMSPIGGQGMNTGFADAEFCANILRGILLNNKNKEILFKKYQFYRKKAAKVATKRAYSSMRIGTMNGIIISGIRNFLISVLLPFFKNKIPYYFSMLSSPYGTFDKVKEKEEMDF